LTDKQLAMRQEGIFGAVSGDNDDFVDRANVAASRPERESRDGRDVGPTDFIATDGLTHVFH
jgi:hypothetical protein